MLCSFLKHHPFYVFYPKTVITNPYQYFHSHNLVFTKLLKKDTSQKMANERFRINLFICYIYPVFDWVLILHPESTPISAKNIALKN